MDHLDDLEKPLKDLIANIYHLPYNERDLESAYELGKKVILDKLLEHRKAICNGSTLIEVIDLESAQKEVHELCDLE